MPDHVAQGGRGGPPEPPNYDVAILGGGPGGYVAGIRLGQLGRRAVVIEREALGGVCLNWGCIPSKAVIHAAELRHEAQRAATFGIGTGAELPLDVAKLRTWKEGIVTKLRGGVAHLLKANGTTVVQGAGKLTGPRSLEVQRADGSKLAIEADAIVVATGARTIELPFLPRSHARVWDAQELMNLAEVPRRLAIVGGGVIGLETACSYQKLGSQVTIVEMMPTLLPGVDPELVAPVRKRLEEGGATVHLEARASALVDGPDGAVLKVQGKQGPLEVACDRVLVAVGFRPNVEGIGLDAAGVQVDKKGFIAVDRRCQTNVPSVYAIGDVTGPPYLAHRASKQGIVVAEVLAGEAAQCDFQAMPGGIFSDPEVGTVGLSEQEAVAAGHEVSIGRFPFAALGRALAQEQPIGLVKVVSDAKTGVLLGVGVVGPRANDLIAEAALAIEMGAQTADVALTIHTHPTFSEALCEAAEDALGHAIHIARKRRPAAVAGGA